MLFVQVDFKILMKQYKSSAIIQSPQSDQPFDDFYAYVQTF